MALSPKLSNEAASVAADAVTSLLDDGYLRIYDGSKPADADTAVTTQHLLAELRYEDPAFMESVNGLSVSNELTADDSANATGVATWFRALSSDGSTAVFDGSVGTSGCNLNLTDVNIQESAEVSITAHTYRQQKG